MPFFQAKSVTATVTATTANYGERWRTTRISVKYSADVGERPRTVVNSRAAGLKTTKVQAFGGSNPSPSVFEKSLFQSDLCR